MDSPFANMQKAVDIVNSSDHPTNKIAATLAGAGHDGMPYSISMTNYWPDRIHARFGRDARIGSSSGTIHAETACILTAPRTAGASLFITDPFCPNCAKNIAEAGIEAIYIDHKGFAKDFAERRGGDFGSMSMRICEKAGIRVYEINRREQTLNPILEPANRAANEERPVTLQPLAAAGEDTLKTLVLEQLGKADKRKFAVGIARDPSGGPVGMTAYGHVAVGYSWETDQEEIAHSEGKYTFMLEPVNRLLMNAARYGIRLIDGMIYASRVPTSRELVNLVGAGITEFYLGSEGEARDQDALNALAMLKSNNVLKIKKIP